MLECKAAPVLPCATGKRCVDLSPMSTYFHRRVRIDREMAEDTGQIFIDASSSPGGKGELRVWSNLRELKLCVESTRRPVRPRACTAQNGDDAIQGAQQTAAVSSGDDITTLGKSLPRNAACNVILG
jgi:hypothetical protein